ncbi:type 1 glutamine amidotransferase domain-containing protein [Cognatilysobacter tabacisoli]|uniref:type 1 glutamine amidotransferase domain-containing protein n=1 Tax=Cognatilysobacter tabacisoli TaxID=2315424 RepID=UPI000E6B2198|nr:type 1 glutamine amidotransferase domain-containing protein [Lysobacter tabacisoli]
MPRVLMIVTSTGTLPDGGPTGLWLEEFAVPALVLGEAGAELVVASPRGGAAPVDPRSERDPDKHPGWAEAARALADTVALDSVRADEFDAVFIAGGHGTMFDFPGHPALARLLADVHAQGKPIAAVCHGPAAFVGVVRADGRPLVDGYTITAFSDLEEKLVKLDDAVPFLLSARLRELGATVQNGVPVLANVREDRQLITGQNPKSSREAAERLVRRLRT